MTLPFQQGSSTSLEAAERAEAWADTAELRVLQAIRAASKEGLTDEEGAEITGLNPNTYRPRRVRLVEKGLVYDSGQKRRTRSSKRNCRATVWVAVKPGEQLMLF